MDTQDLERARSEAEAQLHSIIEMVEGLDTDNEADLEEAQQSIQEDPLSIQVRSDWHSPGSSSEELTEYEILLCTGGPATRIIGKLGQYNEPVDACLQFQDWFTPWVNYECGSYEQNALIKYAEQFWYGE